MVCPRCILAVRTLLVSKGFTPVVVNLGDVEIEEELDESRRNELDESLRGLGFELLDDPKTQLVELLRIAVLEWVRMRNERPKISDYLSDRLSKDYSFLSRLFREVKGITIERFTILHRIEYAKELLCYSQLSISEIAYQLGYSSPTHLANQFRQETGISPKMFRQQGVNTRISLSDI